MQVKWYSGYKGEEKPATFTVNGAEQIIRKVISEELVEDSLTGKRKRIFKVKTDKGIYKLIYNGSVWTVNFSK
ncbi:hypothetical protein KAW65_02200 [candidate division WOR-3 bacterium]|nr:hypothetical protein [candidate division WOR-3 bacterium]